ncbi:unnamed protein product, partial [Ectocarpus fasciculatus]
CGACRSVQTLHVRIDGQTPRSLWSPRTSQITASGRRREVCISSRVPAVQAYGVTWGRRYLSAARLRSVIWPVGLKRLMFSVDTAVNVVSWPASLER